MKMAIWSYLSARRMNLSKKWQTYQILRDVTGRLSTKLLSLLTKRKIKCLIKVLHRNFKINQSKILPLSSSLCQSKMSKLRIYIRQECRTRSRKNRNKWLKPISIQMKTCKIQCNRSSKTDWARIRNLTLTPFCKKFKQKLLT